MAILRADGVGCEDLADELTRVWTRRQRIGARWRRARNRVLRRIEAPLRWPARGLLIALVGPDGAGKTTLADAVRACYPLPSRAVHMGIWREGPWNGRFARIPGGPVLQRTGRIVRGSLTLRYHRARGRLLLQDRFAQEVLLPGAVDTSRGGRFNRALSLWLAPEPDLVLLLDAPGELMFRRKGEHSPEVLEERRQGYLAMVTALPHGAVLDATRPIDDVTRAASAAVWRAISASSAASGASRRGAGARGPRR
jgi:thymidylate kinase